MIELTEEENFRHYIEDKCFICEKPFFEDAKNDYIKVRDHCHYTRKHRGAAHKICNLMYNTPREIPVVFHNGFSYDYHFIMKGLAEEFERDFECLGENKEKYITFSVPIKKESNEERRGKKSGKLLFKCFNCKRKSFEEFDEDLIKKLKNTYRFCTGDIDKFMLLLRKSVYPDEYMDDWDIFNEEKLPNKCDFYSSLNMEDISEIDYRHATKVFNKFNSKNLGEYHDLYVQSDTLLLADVFESFRNFCIKTYKLDPAYFLSLSGLAWQACLKRTGVKLELISDIDVLLMIEEGIKGGICHSVLNTKANNKYMKDYDENKDDSFLLYTDYNNLYGKAMSEKLPVDVFEWIEDITKVDQDFIKNYDEDSDVGYFIKADIEYPKELHNKHSDLPFLLEIMKVNKCKKLVCNLYDKKRLC